MEEKGRYSQTVFANNRAGTKVTQSAEIKADLRKGKVASPHTHVTIDSISTVHYSESWCKFPLLSSMSEQVWF